MLNNCAAPHISNSAEESGCGPARQVPHIAQPLGVLRTRAHTVVEIASRAVPKWAYALPSHLLDAIAQKGSSAKRCGRDQVADRTLAFARSSARVD